MVGCGNHGCIINPPEKGSLATNGVCYCLNHLEFKDRVALTRRVEALETKIKEALRIAKHPPIDRAIIEALEGVN